MSTSNALRTRLLSAAAIATLAALPQLSFADELWNFFTTPESGATDFEAMFTGNILGDIDINNAPGYDPFINGTMTDNYNGASNTTTVVWAGNAGPPWANGSIAGGGTVHFGIQGGPWLTPNAWEWTFPSNPAIAAPALDLAPNWALPATPTEYITIFAQVTDPTTNLTAGNWFELPFTPGALPSITLTDPDGDSLNFNNVGYMLSPTQIPLDDLNFGTEPPPGMGGSQFTPLSDPPSLSPGGSEVDDLPEPAAMGLMVLGGMGLLLRRCKTAG